MGHRQYNVCPVCEEAYDCGERHVCEGPPPPKAAVPRVDKHLEACRRNVCPHCGARVVMVRGPEGTAVMREVLPKSFWPDPSGPEMVMGIDDTWQRGRLEGDSNVKHTVGFPIHKCGEEAAR